MALWIGQGYLLVIGSYQGPYSETTAQKHSGYLLDMGQVGCLRRL